jgi:hypothetical protein
MRLCTLALILVALAGCDMGPPSAGPARRRDADAEAKRLAEARKLYNAFLDEAEKGLQLLETHAKRDALRDEVKRLQEKLSAADDAAPGSDKMGDLVDEGRGLLRFFTACLKVAEFQADRKDISPEKAQSYVDRTCDANAGPIRQGIPQLRAKNEPAK